MSILHCANNKSSILFYIKLGILLFWGCWFSLACLTNFFDGLLALGTLPANWQFHSGNYLAVRNVFNIYSTPEFILDTLFSIDILLQLSTALLFFYAALKYYFKIKIGKAANLAYGLSMALWATFILLDEVFLSYGYEHHHQLLLMFELVTFLSLYILPDHTKE